MRQRHAKPLKECFSMLAPGFHFFETAHYPLPFQKLQQPRCHGWFMVTSILQAAIAYL